jgi:hypothetical protein
MKAYYFVITPLNYLCAEEFKHKFSNNYNEHVLIILADYPKTIKQIKKIITIENWDAVLFLFENNFIRSNNVISFSAHVLKRAKKLKAIITKNDISSIILGNMNNNYCRFIYRHFKGDSSYIIDDGFVTVFHKHQTSNNLKNKEKIKKLGKGYIEKLILNVSKIKWENLSFFSIFNTDRNVSNRFDLLKSKLKSYKPVNQVFFIGQPLVAYDLVSEETYISTVNKIFSEFTSRGYECFYLPHRINTNENIPSHWKTKSFDYPIECYPVFNNTVPEAFFSFYSTAIFSLSLILDESHNFNFIKASDFINNEKINILFDYLESNHDQYNYKVLDLIDIDKLISEQSN